MAPDPRPTLLPGTLLRDEEEASAPGIAEPADSGSDSWTSPSCSSCPPSALVQALLSFPPRLSLFPVSRIFLFSLFRWSRTQLSRGRSCISPHVLVSTWSFSFSSSLCQQRSSPLPRARPPAPIGLSFMPPGGTSTATGVMVAGLSLWRTYLT